MRSESRTMICDCDRQCGGVTLSDELPFDPTMLLFHEKRNGQENYLVRDGHGVTRGRLLNEFRNPAAALKWMREERMRRERKR